MSYGSAHHTPWRNWIPFLTFVFLLTGVGNLPAAEKGDGDGQKASRVIVVTPTRTERDLMESPSSISVVSEEELKRSEAASIADVLQDVPGVEVFDQSVAGSKRVLIRGESGSRVLVLIDGQKISEQKSMDGAALLIDTNRIDRIEVIKGPASVLYGSEAIGGVVNIITKKGGDRPIQAEITGTYDSSADGIAGYASVFGGYNGFQYRLSGNWTDYDDRDTPEGKLENSYYDSQDYSLFLGYDHGKFSAGIAWDKYESDVNSHTPDGTINETMTYFQLDLPQWNREKIRGFAELRDVADSLPRMRLDAYFQNTLKEFKNDMDINVSMGPMGRMTIQNRITTENDQDAWGGNFQVDWTPGEDHYLIFGYEPIFDSLNADQKILTTMNSPMPPPGSITTTTDVYRYEAKMNSHALYVQDEWCLPADLTATLGLRQTWVTSELKDTNNPNLPLRDSNDSHPVFSAGLTWSGLDQLVLRGVFAQGYRFPNLQQLFIGTVHGSSKPTYPNPDLAPETSNNYEIGARYNNGDFVMDITGFYSDAEDYITTEPVTGGRQFTNVDEAQTQGLELSLSYTLTYLGLTPYAGVTWMRREFTHDDFSTTDTGHPNLWGRVGVRYERMFGKNIDFYSDLYARWATEAKEESFDGTEETYGSWETLNLMFGARFGAEGQYFTTVNLNNLFDRSYAPAQASIDQPGFHAVIKAGLSF